jgi:prophage maintenance system killer protein
MEDLTVELVITVHTRISEGGGGDSRIISEANLHQLVFRANLIPECVPRAAFIFYSLCAYPVFREGNSGTALAMTEQMLASGGYRITGETTGIMALAEGILAFTAEPEEVEDWLCNHTEKSAVRQ